MEALCAAHYRQLCAQVQTPAIATAWVYRLQNTTQSLVFDMENVYKSDPVKEEQYLMD